MNSRFHAVLFSDIFLGIVDQGLCLYFPDQKTNRKLLVFCKIIRSRRGLY